MAGFDLRQQLKFTQQLLMTPQLQQAIKLLQLSRIELEEFVSQQLAENPVLEEGVVESQEERIQTDRERERTEDQAVLEHMGSASDIVDRNSDKAEDFDWESFSRQTDSQPPTPSSQNKNNEEFPNYENIVRSVGSLQDHLMIQLGEQELDPNEQKIAEVIVGNIDDRGYLATQVDDIATAENVSLDLVEDILDVVQRLDPPGVGARNLAECLLIQLRQAHLKNGIVEKIVENHLPELENRNFPAIAKSLNISVDEVIKNIQIIADLEPIPGRQFGREDVHYIVPDVYVFQVSGEWVVALNDEGLPKLRVSNMYQEMVDKKEAKGKEKEYLQEKLKSADWLIRSIQQRQKTIFRVTQCIVARQQAFLDRGVEYLKPMKLKDIAEDISLHESTISRVTNNKYVHTPRGIFELKYFFNSSVQREDGENLASVAVKKMISDLVKAEDAASPLSDQRIVEILSEKGIQLARRTVAKYREQLNISPSSRRKKAF